MFQSQHRPSVGWEGHIRYRHFHDDPRLDGGLDETRPAAGTPTLSEAATGLITGAPTPALPPPAPDPPMPKPLEHVGLAAQLISGDENTLGDRRFRRHAPCRWPI
jgi:hypothetical protein